MGDKANGIPLSPIIDNWQNIANSENISQGFITSTQKRQIEESDDESCFENSEILFPPRKKLNFRNHETNRSTPEVPAEQLIALQISPFLEELPNFLNQPSTSSCLNENRLTDLQDSIETLNVSENLSEKMNTIISKITNLERNMEKQDKENQNHRNAQNKLNMETLIHVKKVNQLLSRLVGDQEDSSVEFETVFPIKSIAELSDMELRLIDKPYLAKLIMFLTKLKGSSSLDSVFRFIATDDVYHDFNLNGRAGKRSLNSLKLFNSVMFDACGGLLGRENFQDEIRKCIQHAHNRFFKNKK